MNKRNTFYLFSCLAFICLLTLFSFNTKKLLNDDKIISYVVDVKTQDLKLYWKDDSVKNFKSILRLKSWLESKKKKLVFAMNGGMYMEDNAPLGLFIQEGKTIRSVNTNTATGNFYLMPNGIFYITNDKIAYVSKTADFIKTKKNYKINYATQSGPMLLIDGEIHPEFREGSSNLNIRNGVGILSDNKVIFAMSKEPINFYDFAMYFKKAGCKNALYLDGFVSRTYLPEKNWMQTDGNFGVIIAVTSDKKIQ
ncbi:MAG: phosphodiester glycosidase family protein [Bacteroidetes bacterium]|nr:phosphodiester glycosidase family protein [Bacteroidota bacterium]